MSKTKSSQQAHKDIGEQDVIEYLRNHLDTLERHPEV